MKLGSRTLTHLVGVCVLLHQSADQLEGTHANAILMHEWFNTSCVSVV